MDEISVVILALVRLLGFIIVVAWVTMSISGDL